MWKRWVGDRSGTTAIEYALIALLVAVAVAGAIASTGGATNGLYTKVGDAYNRYIVGP